VDDPNDRAAYASVSAVIVRTLRTVTEGLREQPMLLSLFVINLLFIAALAFMLLQIANSVERKDQLMVELLQHCVKGQP
jgi:hypothetical protein